MPEAVERFTDYSAMLPKDAAPFLRSRSIRARRAYVGGDRWA